MAHGITPTMWQRGRPDRSTILLAIATAALIAIDLAHLTIATGLAAVALALFVVGYVTRWHALRVGIYLFLFAELSPVSLQADFVTALTYQAACVLLLTATIAPFPHLSKFNAYARPVLMTLLVTVVSAAPGLILFYTTSLAALQAASLSGVILLVITSAVLFVRRDMLSLQAVRGA